MRTSVGQTITAVSMVAGLAVVSAEAQPRVEVSGIVGWTLADGVTGDGVVAGDGNIYDEVTPKDSASWGLGIGVNATSNIEVGFLFGQQRSSAEVKGTATREIGDLTIDTYHPYVAYNLAPPDAPLRPYFLVGVGATNYGGVSFVDAGGNSRETASETQFSTTFGAGIKFFAERVGARLGMQWTPTYIKTDAVGWWCDPFWGCYVLGDEQYANQLQFSGGVTLRF